jgi:galactonate dehydratase
VKVTDIDVLKVDASWRNWVFVRIETDRGLVGWGECTVEGREHAVAGAIEDMRRRVVGRDPRRIREIVHVLTRHGYWEAGPVVSSAVAGIEMALWDLTGKALDLPVHALLGGSVRDRIDVYSNAWYFGASTPDEFASRAATTVVAGYRALKFDPFGTAGSTIRPDELRDAVDRVGAVREAVGPDVQILVECHGRFDLPSALAVARALRPLRPAFLEEPLPPGDPAPQRRLAEAIDIPVAAGERLYSPAECLAAITNGGVAILQADVIHVGGIGALMAAAAIADAQRVPLAPHNASGPVATAATLQVATVVPNLFLQEMFAPQDASWRDAVARPPIEVRDGTVAVPEGPGLGIDVDELEARMHPFEPRDLAMYDPDESILTNPVDRRPEAGA